jgi:hypothetical protein
MSIQFISTSRIEGACDAVAFVLSAAHIIAPIIDIVVEYARDLRGVERTRVMLAKYEGKRNVLSIDAIAMVDPDTIMFSPGTFTIWFSNRVGVIGIAHYNINAVELWNFMCHEASTTIENILNRAVYASEEERRKAEDYMRAYFRGLL